MVQLALLPPLPVDDPPEPVVPPVGEPPDPVGPPVEEPPVALEPPSPPDPPPGVQPRPSETRQANNVSGVEMRIRVPLFQFVIGCRSSDGNGRNRLETSRLFGAQRRPRRAAPRGPRRP